MSCAVTSKWSCRAAPLGFGLSAKALFAAAILSSLFADVGWAQQGPNNRDSKSDGQRSSDGQVGGQFGSRQFGSGQFGRSTSGELSRPAYGEFSRPALIPRNPFEPRATFEQGRPIESGVQRSTPPIHGRPPVVHLPIIVRQPITLPTPPVVYHSPGAPSPAGFSGQPSWIYYLPDGNSYMLATSSGLMGPYTFAPIDAQADAQFGPLAVQQFMGVQPAGIPNGIAAQQVGVVGLQQPAIGQGGLPGDAPQRPKVRPSDAAARDRAWRQIELGDAEFLQREFSRALDHYRNAAVAAADLGEAFFRQGHALVALGLYDQAAKAMRRGLLFDADWADSDFHLDDLYGDNKPVKNGKLDTLEKAAAAHLQDPELQFLAGVELFFDDRFDRAAPFLRRADAMYGPQVPFLQGFLKKLPAPKAAEQQPEANMRAAPKQKPVAADEGLDT